MEEKQVRLRFGGELVVRCLAPPVPERLAGPIITLVQEGLHEPFLPYIVRGQWSDHGCFRVVYGEINGELAGTCWVGWSERIPDLAVIGGVVTKPGHRRQGVAAGVCSMACEAFDRAGGRLLHLAAVTSGARRIYERLGFQSVVGRLLCRRAPGARQDEGFAPGQAVRSRAATCGDLAAIVPLYVFPHESILVDAGTPLASARVGGPSRCAGIFWNTWRTVVMAGGRWQILENERGWPVASAVARRPGSVPHLSPGAFAVDFIWHPSYGEDSRAFVSDFLQAVEQESGAPCEMAASEEDAWKLEQARRLGFARTGRSGGTVDLHGRKWQLVALTRSGKFN